MTPVWIDPFAAFALPESIRFLVVRGDRPDEIARLLDKLTRSRDYAASDSYTIPEERTRGFAAALYPTTMRSTGIAWALGVGRAGTMLGSIVGSPMLAAKMAPAAILYSTASRRRSRHWRSRSSAVACTGRPPRSRPCPRK